MSLRDEIEKLPHDASCRSREWDGVCNCLRGKVLALLGQHQPDCWLRREQLIDRDSGPVVDTNFGCTCGLSALLAQPETPLNEYLKDGETVIECLERNRRDADATLTLLAAEKRRSAHWEDIARRLQTKLDLNERDYLAMQPETPQPEESLREDVRRLLLFTEHLAPCSRRYAATGGCTCGLSRLFDEGAPLARLLEMQFAAPAAVAVPPPAKKQIERIEEQLRSLTRYNCDCLPNGPDGKTMATDAEAASDDCFYCERAVVLDTDLAGTIGMLRTLSEQLEDSAATPAAPGIPYMTVPPLADGRDLNDEFVLVHKRHICPAPLPTPEGEDR